MLLAAEEPRRLGYGKDSETLYRCANIRKKK